LFTERTGHLPSGWQDLISGGLLRGVPVDPKNNRYQLVAGRVQVEHPELFPFITKGLPRGVALGDLPGEAGFKVTKKPL
jgi:hypothetical protein